jgi:hypothetical protein
MRRARTIVHKSEKKKMGRPRSVSDEADAPAISVRLPLDVVTQLEAMAAEKGARRSDVLRELVMQAIKKRRK